MHKKKKVSPKEFSDAIEKHGDDRAAIMAALEVSRATYFRLLSQHRNPPLIPILAAVVAARGPAVAAAGGGAAGAMLEGGPVHTGPPEVSVPKPPGAEKLPAGVDLGDATDLSSLIPKLKPEFSDYTPRQPWFDDTRRLLEGGFSVGTFGEAGTGKTSSAKYLAAHRGVPYLEISSDVLLAFSELFGQVNITEGTSHYVEALFLKIGAGPCVILIDEANALDPAKSFKLHQLLNSREVFVKEANRGQGKLYKFHDEAFIILAGNPASAKYSGTNPWNVALIDRLQVVNLPPLSAEEVDAFLPAHEHKAGLVKYYRAVRAAIESEDMRTEFTIRTIRKVMGNLDLGLPIGRALFYAFLNGVKATDGAEGYEALSKAANLIWSFESEGGGA